MEWRGVRRVRRAFSLWRRVGPAAVAVFATSLAGCSSKLDSFAAAASTGATITFESIDGPPPEVFRKLVNVLNDEAGVYRIAVVPRAAPATYPIRGSKSAMVDRKNRTSFSWVWDVYDADKNRVLRLAGEEPAAAAGRRQDAWAVANEQVLHGMSRSGMERIAAFLNSDRPLPQIAPEPALLTLASSRDDSPEAAGIVQIEQPPAASTAETMTETPPQPKPHKRHTASAKASKPVRQSTALVIDR
jgi:hypothetical protein